MHRDSDLPDLSSLSSPFTQVTSVAGVKPVKGFSNSRDDEKKHRRPAETDFRKKLVEAIGVLREREAKHALQFELAEYDGELVVSIISQSGEPLGLMSAEDALNRAVTGDETAFFINKEC